MKLVNIINKINKKSVISNGITLTILFIVLAGVFVPFSNVFANASSDCRDTGGVWVPNIATGGGTCATNTNDPQQRQAADKVTAKAAAEGNGAAGWIWKKFAQGIGYTLITLSSLALLLSGWLFDKVIQYTIIDMAKNLGGGPGGIGDAITLAWATLRDIANMAFIFVLLYAAFKTMFDSNFGNFGKTVKDIIIVALLINFSLFFSKVVIDASNIVAIGFYNSITTGQTTLSSGNGTAGGSFQKSISANYMNMLGLQTFFGSNILTNNNLTEGWQILTVGIMTAIIMLITSVIFLIAGIMFAARFIILIFIMILSPLALIAYIIPGMKNRFEEWKDALINQSFFAPLYFALTWVVFKLGTSLIGVLGKSQTGQPLAQWSEITTNPSGVMPLIINYVLIMGFSIAALIFAKQMASKTAGFKQISGGIGAGVMGGAALAGRKSFGQIGQRVANSQWLRERAPDSRLARTALKIGEKTGSASFDLRASDTLKKVPGLGDEMKGFGKAGGKGGYQAAREDKIKRRMEFMDKNLQDNVTGASLEKEMEKIGYGKAENSRLGRTASEVEAKRIEMQKNLEKDAEANTKLRKERYLHNLSQTRSRLQNTYSGVYEDAEAAKRMRAGKKAKTKKEKLLDDLLEEMNSEKKGTGGEEEESSTPPKTPPPKP